MTLGGICGRCFLTLVGHFCKPHEISACNGVSAPTWPELANGLFLIYTSDYMAPTLLGGYNKPICGITTANRQNIPPCWSEQVFSTVFTAAIRVGCIGSGDVFLFSGGELQSGLHKQATVVTALTRTVVYQERRSPFLTKIL